MITTRQATFTILLMFTVTLAPLGALAQPNQVPLETGVFEVQHATQLELEPILEMFKVAFGPVQWSFDSRRKMLIVRAPGEIMPAIERVVRRVDVPAPAARSIELTAFILMATNDAAQQARAGSPADLLDRMASVYNGSGRWRALPPQLGPVVEQLRGVLPYRVFNFLDSAIVRGVDKEVIEVQGVMPQIPGVAPDPPNHYYLRAELIVTGEPDDRRVVRLDNLRFRTTAPHRGVSIETSIEIAEGEYAVVGKTSVGDNALILIMNVRVID